MFLTQDDYKAQIKDNTLSQVLEWDDTVREQAELAAQEELASYLRPRYDVDAIFAASGTDRSPLVIMWMIDIALYHLWCRVNPRQIPQIRIDRYNHLTDGNESVLAKIQAGKVSPALPRAEDEDGNPSSTPSVFGSNEKLGGQDGW